MPNGGECLNLKTTNQDKKMEAATCETWPVDADHDETAKRIIARSQMSQINEFAGTFCAKCRKQMRVTMAYKCRWCGVWYCHQCGADHFGPESKRTADAPADGKPDGQEENDKSPDAGKNGKAND